ncbi:MAG: ABC transporter permease [Planctomycetaceae bacterium]
MIKLAISNLLSRPLRSLLALLGLTVAIVGMVGLFSVAEGLDRLIGTTFGRIPGLIAMQPGAPIPLFSVIPAQWEQEIEAVPGVDTVSAEVWKRVNVINGKMIVSPPRFLFGTNLVNRHKIKSDPYQVDLIAGRFLNSGDRGTSNTVVSRQISEEFDTGLGQSLTVNRRKLRIVGIYHCDSLLLNVAIILDIDVVRQMTRMSAQTVSSYYIQQSGTVDDEQLIKNIQTVFVNRRPTAETGNPLQRLLRDWDRGIRPHQSRKLSDPSTIEESNPPAAASELGTSSDSADPTVIDERIPIEVRSAQEWAGKFDEFSSDLDLFLTAMTAIGVTIAILSIVNTMLMSVTERIIEFGILKANGWSRSDVLKLIGWESAVLGLAGGVLGSFLGWVLTLIVNMNWPERIQLYASPQLLLTSVLFATFLGLAGGLYPAVWAMRMLPMDAMRRG